VFKPFQRDEVAHLLVSVSEIEPSTGGPNVPYEDVTLPCGVVTPRPERVVTLITKLVFPPNSAGGAPEITSSD